MLFFDELFMEYFCIYFIRQKLLCHSTTFWLHKKVYNWIMLFSSPTLATSIPHKSLKSLKNRKLIILFDIFKMFAKASEIEFWLLKSVVEVVLQLFDRRNNFPKNTYFAQINRISENFRNFGIIYKICDFSKSPRMCWWWLTLTI